MNKYIQNDSRSLIETILVLLLLLSLMLALYDVLKVFFGVLTFALIFSVSFASPFEWLVRSMGGRRKLAAVIYSIVLVAIVAIPFLFIVSAVRSHIKEAVLWLGKVKENGIPDLPVWIANMPLVGEDVRIFWQQLQDSPRDAIAHNGEQVRVALRHLLTSGVGMIGTVLQFIVGIFISAFFLASGEKMLAPIKSSMEHLLGRRDGLSLLAATTQAVKGVSIGVMGTAFIAAIIAWIGLAIAGVSFSLLLAGIVFFLVLIQLGPLLVWVPLVIWTFVEGRTGTTVFLVIYGVALLVIDAFLKPILIAKSGGRIPFLVLFLGVIGGLAAWGFTGMFKGAIIVAVFHTVFTSWLQKKRRGLRVS
ncbi:MAG: AI-2E family transporter [Bacteroidetes bacterium]|nr:AI-2E family transporter [Bacteroidota bacterium]